MDENNKIDLKRIEFGVSIGFIWFGIETIKERAFVNVEMKVWVK
jgi:hypothetical protein